MAEKKCCLRSVEGLHEPIPLLSNTPLTLGRGPVTKIKDSRCSRAQVLLVADFNENIVKATQLGRNSCALDGVEMKKDKPVEISHGQKLDILLGQYTYVLEFDPPPGMKTYVEGTKTAINDVSDSDGESDVTPSKQPRHEPTSSGHDSVTSHLWESVDNDLLIYTSPSVIPKSRIAGYDLDHTIICTKSGSLFPKNANDWQLMYPEVSKKLTHVSKNGYKIVIFTNQAGLSGNSAEVKNFQLKIERIVAKLEVPISVYLSRGKANYRKPCTGMWQAMLERNRGIKVNVQASFYCGDAAGRQAAPGKKADFSQADVLFARNLQLNFLTPEEHFLDVKDNRPVRITAFDPKAMPCDIPLCDPEYRQILSQKPELVLLVGSPGSGKSHFAQTHLVPGGYKRVNRDELGSMVRCVQTVETYLQRGLHVVVDNTNPSRNARVKFIDLAKKYKLPVRAFIMNTTAAHAKHNNKFRQLTDKSHAVVGDVIIQSYVKSYEEPKLEEGLTEIVKINFWPTFPNPELEKLYKMYLTEK